MRTHNELIQCVIDNFDKFFTYGLCGMINAMLRHNVINQYEYRYLRDIIKQNGSLTAYHWPMGEAEPRIEWLKSQLEPEPELEYPQ